MFRKTIILDGSSNATVILTALRNRCAAAGLSPAQTETLIAEVRPPLDALIQSGREVTSASGQFRASRQVVTDSAAITLEGRFGVPAGLFARLRKVLWGGS